MDGEEFLAMTQSGLPKSSSQDGGATTGIGATHRNGTDDWLRRWGGRERDQPHGAARHERGLFGNALQDSSKDRYEGTR